MPVRIRGRHAPARALAGVGAHARALATVGLAAVFLALAATPAGAAVPPNDAPAGAAAFEAYSAVNGSPQDLQAVAELVEATPDGGVPRCLGAASFARTAWYRIPAAATPQQLTVEGFGRTLDVVDLAAFVQPAGAPAPVTVLPNACAGADSGGADAGEEPTSGVALRVPAGRDVLLQVGRRGAVGTGRRRARAALAGRTAPSRGRAAARRRRPRGHADRGLEPRHLSRAAQRQRQRGGPGAADLPVAGIGVAPVRARQLRPAAHHRQRRLGEHARRVPRPAARRPATRSTASTVGAMARCRCASACVAAEPLWLRVGTNSVTGGAGALLRVRDGTESVVVDGGPGGFDPTPGGPGGGLPEACDRAAAERARIGGPRFGGRAARAARRSTVVVRIRVRGSSACDARLTLVGPGGDIYARARAIRLHGRQAVRLAIVRPLERGRYRLRVVARSERGGHAEVRSTVRGRLAVTRSTRRELIGAAALGGAALLGPTRGGVGGAQPPPRRRLRALPRRRGLGRAERPRP